MVVLVLEATPPGVTEFSSTRDEDSVIAGLPLLENLSSRPLLGRYNQEALSKKATNSARNRKTLQEKAQNLNESQLLPVYFYG